MPASLRNALLSARDLLISAGPVALLGAAMLVLAYDWLNPTPPKQLQRELDARDLRVARVSVPLSYANELYSLRANINLVRARLTAHAR